MRKVLGTLATIFAIFFFAPTGLILASWNAIPGDTLYSTKRAFEGVALAITVKTPIGSALSINFTDRRFKEADKLLANKGSTLGYSLLVEQAQQTQKLISDQKDPKKAAEFIASIDEYQKSIEAKSTALQYQASTTSVNPVIPQTQVTANTNTVLPTSGTAQTTTQTPSQKVNTPTAPVAATTNIPTSTAQTQENIIQLNQVNENLEKIKEEVKKDLPPQASERAREIQNNKEQNIPNSPNNDTNSSANSPKGKN
ncbi:MAG TPA: hypothetical protein VF185_03550 [Patescibacteria group bacterium]